MQYVGRMSEREFVCLTMTHNVATFVTTKTSTYMSHFFRRHHKLIQFANCFVTFLAIFAVHKHKSLKYVVFSRKKHARVRQR